MRRLIVATVVAVGLLGVEAGVASADIYLNVQQGQWVSGAIGNCVWSAATGQYILASYTEMDYWGPQCTGAGYEVVNVRGHNALVWDPAAVNVSYLEYPSGVAGSWYTPLSLGNRVAPYVPGGRRTTRPSLRRDTPSGTKASCLRAGWCRESTGRARTSTSTPSAT